MTTVSEWWMWLSFFAVVIIMLAVDLFLLGGRKAHRVSTKEALGWTLVWFVLALLFSGFFWWYLKNSPHSVLANQKFLEFLTGYFIEKSLSVDNIFLILMIFTYFSIPAEYQRRVLLYGVLGAIVLRMILILAGLWLISKIHWILYVFGIFLVITGIRLMVMTKNETNLERNPLLRWMRKHLRISKELQGERFFIRHKKLLYVTPLFVVLVLVEISDVIFAVDSIPAIFAITNDPFIVFTSNIFAVLGLRALYFLLANMVNKFHLLKYGLGFILFFVGVKMLIAPWVKIPILIALAVVILTLGLSVVLSVVLKPKK